MRSLKNININVLQSLMFTQYSVMASNKVDKDIFLNMEKTQMSLEYLYYLDLLKFK